ncbi:uncharacterized protein [Rutidosis leptorrhynchoides]|uniref:uncharacterized protein n=1 Tax=Rutidosis leptorrhynchoides TaxID=125765 RepID=UPI003A99F94C
MTDGIFCYVKMPFGLKNAGAPYQCVIDMEFREQISRNVEAYVDDIVIKRNTEERMIRDILETFESLRKINMKLNPKKCAFGVEEEWNGTQMPIYFSSKLLQQSEANYPPIEKLVYALVHTATRLRIYFQGYSILVLTDQPIKQILKHPESSGLLAKWAAELGEYEIFFSPRHAVKGQILADFLLETTKKVDYSHNPVIKYGNCILMGASSDEGVGAELVLTNLEGEKHTNSLKFCFYAPNNEVEYEALLSGLRIAVNMGIKHLRAYVDFQIVAQQVNGVFEEKDISMKRYLQLVEKVSKNFEKFGSCANIMK